MERMETEVVVAGVRRRPYASRRRTRSTGSLPPLAWHPSEDSSSSVGDGKGLSDSDDVQPMGLRQPHPARLAPLHHLMESDSVNENFSPVRPSTRRKRKFKRLAVDVEVGGGGGSQRPPMSCMLVSSGKKKRVLRHVPNCDNRYCLTGASCGKRKRSVRSEVPPSARAMGFATPAARDDTASALHRLSLRDPTHPQPMDVSGSLAHQQLQPVAASSSSVSSSESDTGVFTNDEGREGDDEQSDWFGEAKGWWAGADSDRDEDIEPTFAAILGGTAIANATGKGREIRGGRRRVRAERASFSVFTSANEQLSKFLQDPARSELKLHPMQRREREQLCHLADLYSLNMRVSDGSALTCPVLTKTSNTVRVEQLPLCRLSSPGDCKRRRRAAAATDGGSGHRSSPPDTTTTRHHHSQHQLLGHKSS